MRVSSCSVFLDRPVSLLNFKKFNLTKFLRMGHVGIQKAHMFLVDRRCKRFSRGT